MTVAPSSPRTVLVVLALALVVGLTGCGSPEPSSNARVQAVSDQNGYESTYLGGLYHLPDVSFTDDDGHAYDLATSPSKPVTLVFFGYTNCPDICLAVLSQVAVALQRSSPAVRDQVQLVFVTTDPARDDPATIKSYLARFDPTFIGLTADLPTTKKVADKLGIGIGAKHKLPSGGYDVTHSTPVIGFDKTGASEVMWNQEVKASAMTKDIALLVSRQR